MTDSTPDLAPDLEPGNACQPTHHDGSMVDTIAELWPKLTDAKVQPWRILDADGLEVWWEVEPFEHPTAGTIKVPRAGYDTKAEATDAILRYADVTIDQLRVELAELEQRRTNADGTTEAGR